MNYSVVLPASGPKASYYSAYVGYIRGLLDACGQSYRVEGKVEGTKFLMHINDKSVAIDYSDHYDVCEHLFDRPYFKFHCPSYLKKHENVYPFAPISFYDWKEFAVLRKSIRYTCNNDTVLNLQEPRAGALKRRKYVQEMLRDKFGTSVITKSNLPQKDYWKLINNCLVHVFVPGARNNMIDRGHMQYMAFGCCTICPRIMDELTHGKIRAGCHYVECKADYSDLIEKINWCKRHRDACREIGVNAQRLFDTSCTPQVLWELIRSKI